MKQGFFYAAAFILLLQAGCATVPSIIKPDTENTITEKYWKLTELRGAPVTPGPNDIYITLKLDGSRLIGSGGCNRLSGSYQLEPRNRVKFSQIAITKMACLQGMDTEQQFLDALDAADSYVMTGDQLVLNKARMAPLARFEAVYMH